MKKVFALMLIAVLVLGLSGTAFARDYCVKNGRMTGGGNLDGRAICTNGSSEVKVTHGFVLNCMKMDGPQNLQVNWSGNRFHLEELKWIKCFDKRGIDPVPPAAGFDTVIGYGMGRYNGESGATIKFVFSDAGEPGTDDGVCLMIWDKGGNLVLVAHDKLDGGNHQAHDVK